MKGPERPKKTERPERPNQKIPEDTRKGQKRPEGTGETRDKRGPERPE